MRLCVLAFWITACGPTMGHDPEVDAGGSTGGDDDDVGQRPDGGAIVQPDSGVCAQAEPIVVDFIPAPPDMLLVVDKSGSMGEPLDFFHPFDTKWSVMRSALGDLVTAKDDLIHFGLLLYPSDTNCAAGVVGVDVLPGNAGPVTGAINSVSPGGNTPTHTSLAEARAYYASHPVNPNGRYVLLATDGLPNCAPGPDDAGNAQAVAEVSSLHADGVSTFVIGFGSAFSANPTLLEQLAMAGGTGSYYQADSPDELAAALDAIAGTVILPSCTIDLAATPQDPSLLAVSFDGVPVPRSPSHQNGWDYDPATNTITFYGSACSELQSGSVSQVNVDYGCGGPVIP